MRPGQSRASTPRAEDAARPFATYAFLGLPSQARRPAAPHAGDSAKKETDMKEIRDGPHVALVRVHGHVDRKAAMDAAREIAKEVSRGKEDEGDAPQGPAAARRGHRAK